MLICAYAAGFLTVDSLFRLLLARFAPAVPNAAVSLWRDAVTALFLLVCARPLIRKRVFPVRLRVTTLDSAALVWLLSGLFGCLLSRDFTLTARALRITHLPVVWFLLIRRVSTQAGLIRVYATLVLSLASLTALVGLAMFFLVPSSEILRLWSLKQGSSGLPAETIMRVGLFRMTSFLLSPTPFSSLMAACAVACFAAALTVRRPVYLVLLALFTCCNFLSLTRGGWLLQLTGMITVVAMCRVRLLRLTKRLILISLLLAVLVVGTYAALAQHGSGHASTLDSIERLLTERDELYGRGLEHRLGVYDSIWSDLVIYPFGHGVGMVGRVAARRGDNVRLGTPSVSDGWYAKIAAETGVVGLLAYGFLIAIILAYLVRLLSTPLLGDDLRVCVLGILGIVVGMLAFGVGSNAWDIEPIAPMFWSWFGLVSARAELPRSEPAGRACKGHERSATALDEAMPRPAGSIATKERQRMIALSKPGRVVPSGLHRDVRAPMESTD
ncbi:MAG: O-antigen ligase family protein [Anaerolineae bacterium]